MKTHKGRAGKDAEIGDIVMDSTGDRYRVTAIVCEEDETTFQLHPLKTGPKIWLWVLTSAVVSAAATYGVVR